MLWTRLLPPLIATLTGGACLTPANADDETPARETPLRAHPAVLVLRVWEPPGGGSGPRRMEVVDPRVLDELPVMADRRAGMSERWRQSAPRPGPDYELVGTCAPNPLQSTVRYYVYEFNLSDPGVVRNWVDLHRAEQDELHRDRMRRFNERDMNRRQARLLNAHAEALEQGMAQMRAGDYRLAVITLTLAAELNHGDPACRIHLAQARVAVGQDAEAAKALRRALELQPKLVFMQLGLDDYYPGEDDFSAQVDALAQRMTKKPAASVDEYLLLGFMEFQHGRLDEAHAAFRQAARGRPKDTLIQSFLDVTKPVQLDAARERASKD